MQKSKIKATIQNLKLANSKNWRRLLSANPKNWPLALIHFGFYIVILHFAF